MNKSVIHLIALSLLAILIFAAATLRFPTSLPVANTSPPPSTPSHTNQTAKPSTPVISHNPKSQSDRKRNLETTLQKTSLAGTELPPLPAMDVHGNLAQDRNLRDVFDYFLSLQGELEPADILRLIEDYLSLHLPAQVVTQAMQILEQYQLLNKRLSELATEMEGISLRDKLQKVSAFRREWLGDTIAEAFYSEEEAYDLHTLEMLERQGSSSLTLSPLEAHADALASLPASLQERQKERLLQQFLVEGTQRLQAQGATPAELYQFHLLNGDAAIAERYRALGARREAWQRRLEAYRLAHDEISRGALSDEDKSIRLQQLLSASFNPTEILRINALENMETR